MNLLYEPMTQTNFELETSLINLVKCHIKIGKCFCLRHHAKKDNLNQNFAVTYVSIIWVNSHGDKRQQNSLTSQALKKHYVKMPF